MSSVHLVVPGPSSSSSTSQLHLTASSGSHRQQHQDISFQSTNPLLLSSSSSCSSSSKSSSTNSTKDFSKMSSSSTTTTTNTAMAPAASASSLTNNNSSLNRSTNNLLQQKQQQLFESELIAIKSKFEAEFRRFSLQRSEITTLDDFIRVIEHFHRLFSIPFCLFYTDPVHGDLLPISNDTNFGLAIASAKPLLRIIIQRKGESIDFLNSSAYKKKNFFGTILPNSQSSSGKNRLEISAPEDFRQVSSIIDVDIVPETCRRVRLVKHGSDKPLGFYIRDGTSVRVTAHGVEKVPGIFISRLVPGGLAESTGLLAVNDEVLEVNGIEVTGKSLDQVTDMMVANSSNLIITIRPANQRGHQPGHATLPSSFSSNTIGSHGVAGYHQYPGGAAGGHHTNSLGYEHRHKRSSKHTSMPSSASNIEVTSSTQQQLQSFPHPLQHYQHSHQGPQHAGYPQHQQPQNPEASPLQRSNSQRHSSSSIRHRQHNRYSKSDEVDMEASGSGGSSGVASGSTFVVTSPGQINLEVVEIEDDDDDEDEVRDHFTTSLVLNSPPPPPLPLGEPPNCSTPTKSSSSNQQPHHHQQVTITPNSSGVSSSSLKPSNGVNYTSTVTISGPQPSNAPSSSSSHLPTSSAKPSSTSNTSSVSSHYPPPPKQSQLETQHNSGSLSSSSAAVPPSISRTFSATSGSSSGGHHHQTPNPIQSHHQHSNPHHHQLPHFHHQTAAPFYHSGSLRLKSSTNPFGAGPEPGHPHQLYHPQHAHHPQQPIHKTYTNVFNLPNVPLENAQLLISTKNSASSASATNLASTGSFGQPTQFQLNPQSHHHSHPHAGSSSTSSSNSSSPATTIGTPSISRQQSQSDQQQQQHHHHHHSSGTVVHVSQDVKDSDIVTL